MSVKKNLSTMACVVAMSVGAAVPAMALENEFHGMYKGEYYLTNYQDGASGFLAPPSSSPSTLNPRNRAMSFLEQRGSLIYIGKLNERYKMVTAFELDSRWGDNAYNTPNTVTRNAGGAVGADHVNIETKSLYLDANLPFAVTTNLRLGIQPFMDPYKGIVFGNDGAGAVITSEFNNLTGKAAYFRFYDKSVVNDLSADAAEVPGSSTQDFFMLDGKYAVTKDLKLGATYFLLLDSRRSAANLNKEPNSEVHMFGLNAAANVGPVSLDGFFLYQTGTTGHLTSTTGVLNSSSNQGVNANGNITQDPHRKLSAYAAGLAAKGAVGPGTARMLALYTSGDQNPNGGTRNDFATIRSTETNLYSANMMILLRNKDAINSDRALVHNFNNANQGLIGGFLGYDALFGKVFWNSNVGFAAAAKTNLANDYMGTELNTELGYKFADNFKVSVQYAYVALGGFYDRTTSTAGNPNNPYELRTVATLLF